MLTGGGPPPPPRDPETAEYDQIIAQRRATAALENIAEDLNAGKNLSAADVRSLPSNTLENIAQRGDDYLRDIIDRMAAERRERDEERYYERERER